jgi:hypothetical protein
MVTVPGPGVPVMVPNCNRAVSLATPVDDWAYEASLWSDVAACNVAAHCGVHDPAARVATGRTTSIDGAPEVDQNSRIDAGTMNYTGVEKIDACPPVTLV